MYVLSCLLAWAYVSRESARLSRPLELVMLFCVCWSVRLARPFFHWSARLARQLERVMCFCVYVRKSVRLARHLFRESVRLARPRLASLIVIPPRLSNSLEHVSYVRFCV